VRRGEIRREPPPTHTTTIIDPLVQRHETMTTVVAIVLLATAVLIAQAASARADETVWQLEELRRSACGAMETMVIEGCGGEPSPAFDLLRCCSIVAAYEGTACACEMRKSPFGVARRKTNAALAGVESAVERCRLDVIGLGPSDEVCTESRVAPMNFPFLADWARALGRETSGGGRETSRKVLDSWIAKAAFMIYESIDEQKAAHHALRPLAPRRENGPHFSLCSQLALRASSECAPTWTMAASDQPFGPLGAHHLLTCCDALEAMNAREASCFCEDGVVDALGGRQALLQLERVAADACGFEIRSKPLTFGAPNLCPL